MGSVSRRKRRRSSRISPFPRAGGRSSLEVGDTIGVSIGTSLTLSRGRRDQAQTYLAKRILPSETKIRRTISLAGDVRALEFRRVFRFQVCPPSGPTRAAM